MTIDDLKSEIVNKVESDQGCKLSALIPSLSKEAIISFDTDIILNAIDELVKSGKLISIVYVLSSMPYREKVFLLPKCNKLKIVEFNKS